MPIYYSQSFRERFELVSDEFGLDKEQLMKFFKCSEKEANIVRTEL